MATASRQQLGDDLHLHLNERLQKVLGDHLDTARIAGMSRREAFGVALSALSFEVTIAAIMLQMEEEQYINLCRNCYRHVMDAAVDTVKKEQKRKR